MGESGCQFLSLLFALNFEYLFLLCESVPRTVINRDVQIIWLSIFGPCCDDVIAWALEQFLGPCNNGNEAVEQMPRSVKISILS